MLMVNEFKKWLGLIPFEKSGFSRKRGKHHFLFFPFFVLFSGIAHFCIQSLVPCENGIIVKNLYSGLYSFWTPGLPDGVHGNRPCPTVSPLVCLSLNISETAH